MSTCEPLQGGGLEGKELGVDAEKGEVMGSGSCSLVSYHVRVCQVVQVCSALGSCVHLPFDVPCNLLLYSRSCRDSPPLLVAWTKSRFYQTPP